MTGRGLLVVILLLGCIAPGYPQEPVFRLRDLENNWREYDELKGERLTVVDFWATWCQPCVRSLPALDRMAREYRDRGVSFIGVSIDGPRNQSKVRPFVESMGISYPVLRDMDSELMSELGVMAVPTLIIFRSGEQVFVHEGFRPGDEVIIREHIENLLIGQND
jgi:cytochrome c biogenesis protein CcmG, thiol:disulfide interchange protein DsbE